MLRNRAIILCSYNPLHKRINNPGVYTPRIQFDKNIKMILDVAKCASFTKTQTNVNMRHWDLMSYSTSPFNPHDSPDINCEKVLHDSLIDHRINQFIVVGHGNRRSLTQLLSHINIKFNNPKIIIPNDALNGQDMDIHQLSEFGCNINSTKNIVAKELSDYSNSVSQNWCSMQAHYIKNKNLTTTNN